MAHIQRCLHCGESIGIQSTFCRNCKDADGRAKMDRENKKIFAEAGLEFNCGYCSKPITYHPTKSADEE